MFLVENPEEQRLLGLNNITYISKNSTESEILKQLRYLCKNRKYRQSSISKSLQNKNRLTDREIEIANLLTEGFSTTQISKQLLLRTSTISTFKKRIYSKTNTNNLVQFIKLYGKLED